MLTNGKATVTAAVVASKCGISQSDSETALNKLMLLSMVRSQSVETGDDHPLNVYQLHGEHKMFLNVFPIYELAGLLAEWREYWTGFRC